ncbi:MAG: dephospho-CoA kinase [Pseudomonadota bacterium]
MSDFIVGLTGGIGSGKSAAAEHFTDLGIVVVDADDSGRVVVEPGQPALAQIRDHFGTDILLDDGQLDRAALRARVFGDEAERQWLQTLLHPLIAHHMQASLRAAPSPYAILANAVLFETGQEAWCHRVLVIDVDEQVQLERTMARDANSKDQVESIMRRQMSRADRLVRADDVVSNNTTLADLQQEIDQRHQEYLQLCQTPPAS